MESLVIRFVLGLAFGSFLNVLAFRYDPERFLFSKKAIGGRSYCPHCHRTLRWYDLLPLVSYVLLWGRCRDCKKGISIQYPVVELLAGVLFILPVGMPLELIGLGYFTVAWQILWILVFLGLLLMAVIDVRTQIIPDEFHFWFIFLAAGLIYLQSSVGSLGYSFLGGYALLFGASQNIWINHLLGGLVGGLFFLGLIILTKGKGMGMGDAKLGFSLGFLFGWPDISLAIILAFIFGAIFGVGSIVLGGSRLRSKVPFGPFLALGSIAVILGGEAMLRGYFGLFGL